MERNKKVWQKKIITIKGNLILGKGKGEKKEKYVLFA
jgi:hypothetical protein